MRVIIMVKASKESESGVMPKRADLEPMGKFNEELLKAGMLLAADGLHPSSKGKRVRFTGGKPAVIDGPFAETKELVAGFWLWQVQSLEEAVDWLKRAPFQDADIEIRPLFEAADFGDELTPEMRKREARQRAELENRSSKT